MGLLSGPVSEMATIYVGSWYATLLELVVILDAMALALAICVMIGRGFFALGRDGLLPSFFAKTSRRDTPWVGNLMVAVGGIGLTLLVFATDYATQFGFVDETGAFVPFFPNDQFATFILSATIGSFAIELVYLVLAVAAFRLVPKSGNKRWQYLIVAVAVATPILGFYGALNPDPHDKSNFNWVAAAWTIGLLVLALIWFVILLVLRRDKIDGAAAHAGAHHGVAPLDETLGFEPTADDTALGRDRARLEQRRCSGGGPVGFLRRVEVDGAAVCLGRTADGWVAFQDTCTHEECSLSDGELDGGVIVCPCHASEFDLRTGDVLSPPALEPLPIFEARVERDELQVRLAPPPDAAAAVHERQDHVPEAVAGRPPLRLRPLRASRSTTSTSPTSVSGSKAFRTSGSRCCAARRRCSGSRRQMVVASGSSPVTTTSSRSRRRGELLVGDGRDVARGPHAGGGRGAQVHARYRSACPHAVASARQQGLHSPCREHVRGAHPRPARGISRRPSSGTRSTGSRTSPPRSRCGSSPRSWGSPSTTGGC